MIRAIAAVDDKLGIAANGGIPWNIPEDKRHFRDLTEHGVVVMGWATYEEFAEPLPNRRNIVVSRSEQPVREGFELITDIESLLHEVTEDIWIIGGGALFASTLRYYDELYLTHVQGDFGCDRFFPNYADRFRIEEQGDWRQSGEYIYRFCTYKRQ